MQKWVKVQAGNYISRDKRFIIRQKQDYIVHRGWILQDTQSNAVYEYPLLRDCKLKSEHILKINNAINRKK